MPSRNRGRYRYPPKRRQLVWTIDGIDPVTLSQNGQAVSELLVGFTPAQQAGITIMRIIGSWSARVTSSDAVGALKAVFHVMSRDAFAAASLPELDVDDWSYMYMDSIITREGDVAAAGEKMITHIIDVKAKRKLPTAEHVLVFQHENISSTAVGMEFLWNVRTLIALP